MPGATGGGGDASSGSILLGGYAYCYGSRYFYVEPPTGCAVIGGNAMGSCDGSCQGIPSQTNNN